MAKEIVQETADETAEEFVKEVDLNQYLPEFLRDIREYKAMALAEDPQFNLIWKDVLAAFDEQTVETASDYGIGRLEKILKITPQGELEDRRFAILTKLAKKLPYTRKVLEEILAGLCGENGYTLTVTPEKYTVSVLVDLPVKHQKNAVDAMIRQVCPANMLCLVRLKYNTHAFIQGHGYTHRQLHELTHEEIREGVLEDLIQQQ